MSDTRRDIEYDRWFRDYRECCGTCRYHKKVKGQWTCDNGDSEYYSDWTEYKDGCEEYAER